MKLQRVVAISKQEQIVQLARQVGCEVFAADDLTEAIQTIQSVRPEIILLDFQFGQDTINQFLSDSNNNTADAPVIIVGDGSAEISAFKDESSKIKPCYYLPSPSDTERLENIIQQIKARKSIGDNPCKISDNFFIDELAASAGIVGQIKAVTEMLNL